ncbi:MAG: hypothetical protein H7138_05490 [Myxococcales bacterium]|nr:hypothetical protein [Myxococcales bacterium]
MSTGSKLAQALLATVVISACRTASPAEPPAYIVRPTTESHMALEQAVGKALGDPGVKVEPDALTGNGVLVIERAKRPDPKRLVIEGGDPSAPRGPEERFHLVTIDQRCVLVHDRTDRRFPLIGTECAPR